MDDWIVEENLKPFVETLSGFVGYRFDTWDWDAIRFGIEDTDVGADRWYDYELIGDQTVKLRLAGGPGSGLVHVSVQADQSLEAQAATAAELMNAYFLYKEQLTERRFPASRPPD